MTSISAEREGCHERECQRGRDERKGGANVILRSAWYPFMDTSVQAKRPEQTPRDRPAHRLTASSTHASCDITSSCTFRFRLVLFQDGGLLSNNGLFIIL